MAKYVTEFTGAFFLVLTIGLTVVQEVPLAPLAIGSALMVMVYMGGHVSGAHYNPAVSVALTLAGKLKRRELLPYAASQIAGSLVAAFVVRALVGDYLVVSPGAGVSPGVALLAEALFTAALALVVLNVATDARTEGNSFYGLAIGLTVMTGAFAVGGFREASSIRPWGRGRSWWGWAAAARWAICGCTGSGRWLGLWGLWGCIGCRGEEEREGCCCSLARSVAPAPNYRLLDAAKI